MSWAQTEPEQISGIWYTALDARPLKIGLVADLNDLKPSFLYGSCGVEHINDAQHMVARVSVEVGSRLIGELIGDNQRLALRLQSDDASFEGAAESVTLNESPSRPDALWTATLSVQNDDLFKVLSGPGSVLLHVLRGSSPPMVIKTFRLPDDNRATAAKAFANACFSGEPPKAEVTPPQRAIAGPKKAARAKTTQVAKTARVAKIVRSKPPRPKATARRPAKKGKIRAPLRITPR